MKTFLLLKFGTILNNLGLSSETLIPIILTLVIAPTAIYFLFLLINIIGLIVLKKEQKTSDHNPSVSVVVAIRNGEKSLNTLIDCLLNQNYSGEVEFVLVDDESSDQTISIIKDIEKRDQRFKYVSSLDGDRKLKYKKRALDAGIKKSSNSILLFTDVDCIVGSGWVSSMANSFNDGVDYVIGFSRAKFKFGLANLFQRIDFLILMFSAAATTNIKYPLASSGQNQAYKRRLFNKVGGYDKISKLLMGDDSIFLQLCLKQNINVKFCMNHKSFVYCRPEKTWKSLLLQRMRWAGDGNIMWKYNPIFYLIMASTVFVNLLIIILLFFNWGWILISVITVKFILEGLLAYIGSNKLDKTISIDSFVYWFVLNIPYVCLMCFMSFFIKFISWKKREQS